MFTLSSIHPGAMTEFDWAECGDALPANAQGIPSATFTSDEELALMRWMVDAEPTEQRELANARIHEALAQRAPRLSLAGLGLKTAPPLTWWPELLEVDLSGNQMVNAVLCSPSLRLPAEGTHDRAGPSAPRGVWPLLLPPQGSDAAENAAVVRPGSPTRVQDLLVPGRPAVVRSLASPQVAGAPGVIQRLETAGATASNVAKSAGTTVVASAPTQQALPAHLSPCLPVPTPEQRFRTLVYTTTPGEARKGLNSAVAMLVRAKQLGLPVDLDLLSFACKVPRHHCQQLEALIKRPHCLTALGSVARRRKESTEDYLVRVWREAERLALAQEQVSCPSL
ncbi:hypothetical protein [Roseateles amylovorans]|uniref:Leucine-rich repeat domain-containing protein n=1 Tax=Roseateles amylovorans TaxID=2978473 RepID=A0ABY6B125_9BURK|nr:hypothetical protein [Roseateles amylovorans]UXH78863.1 hypothetical protein N4261_02670 [Roseateles amylovorans]